MGLSIYWQQGVQWTLTTLSLRKGNLKALEMLIFSCKNVRHRYLFEYLFFCSLQVRPIFHIYSLVLLVSGNLLDRVSSLSLLSKQKSKFRVSYPMQLHLLVTGLVSTLKSLALRRKTLTFLKRLTVYLRHWKTDLCPLLSFLELRTWW